MRASSGRSVRVQKIQAADGTEVLEVWSNEGTMQAQACRGDETVGPANTIWQEMPAQEVVGSQYIRSIGGHNVELTEQSIDRAEIGPAPTPFDQLGDHNAMRCWPRVRVEAGEVVHCWRKVPQETHEDRGVNQRISHAIAS